MVPACAHRRLTRFLTRMCTDIAFLEHIENMTPAHRSQIAYVRRSALAFVGGLFLLSAVLPDAVYGYALEGPKWPNGSNPAAQLELGAAGKTLSDGNSSWNAAV